MAVKFVQRFSDPRLYQADAGPGRLLLIMPQGYQYTSIGLVQAWSDPTALAFLYAAGDIGETADKVSDLVAAVQARIAATGAPRGYMWLADPTAWRAGAGGLTAANAPVLGLSADGRTAAARLEAPIAAGARLTVAAGSGLEIGETGVHVTGPVEFVGEHAPTGPAAQSADLSCTEGTLGLLTFDTAVGRQVLLENACWGFQYLHPGPDGGPPAHEWFALAAAGPSPAAVRFTAAVDPSDPLNTLSRPGGPAAQAVRTRLAFTGKDADGAATVLDTPLRTRQGAPVALYPASSAALVFNPGSGAAGRGGALQLAPVGDFELGCELSPDPADLLCGLQGTEVVSFHPRRAGAKGDALRFTPYQPAYAPRFPFPDASPVTAPVVASPALLDGAYTTSWATVVSSRGASVPYVAQARGAALYGQDDRMWKLDTGLMGWRTPADPVAADGAFPLLPYAATGDLRGGAVSPAAAADFEREVLAPSRRRRIPAAVASGSDVYTAVTPSGQLVTVKGGAWSTVQLARTIDPVQELLFTNPPAQLRQAFQSGDLLLVAANADQLGDFANSLDIGGWRLAANVGTRNNYSDYSNVLIIKGRKGRLYDPADPAGSLLANPERWTLPDVFAAPADLYSNPKPPPAQKVGAPAPDETVILAQWLKDYFAAAERSGAPELDRFRAIAKDPDWTGVLVLRADIAKVPDDLVGLLAGVGDPAGFHAHHFGVELTPVSARLGLAPGPMLSGSSSLFGLIDYTDPAFTPPAAGEPARAVPPAPGRVYDFRLLSLKVLFANTAVSTFHSYAQLNAIEWFDTPVARSGDDNPYLAIVLEGTLQSDDGQPVYSMSSDADTIFFFDHDVLAKLEITGAVMSTRDDGLTKDTAGGGDLLARSWFGLTGFLDLKAVHAEDEAATPGGGHPFDVFSFGSDPAAADQPRRGLAFANLGVLMTFPRDRPEEATLELVAEEIRFDPATSTARPGSLFRQFALDVAGLRSGTAQTPPQDAGYLPVAPAARLTGVDGERWWGVDYRLPLGTPGSLAGRAALTAHLLTAWAAQPDQGVRPVTPPDQDTLHSYRAAVALSLPGSDGGAKLIGLQNVLKLSVGQIRLWYDAGQGSFLLLFSEIALKLYGLLSIPPGSTMFSLFGDPSGGGPSGLGWYAMYRKDEGGEQSS